MEKKSEEIVEISHVTNRYRNSGSGFFSKNKTTRVLNDVSLTIHRDEIFGLVGESGCGKSTLGKAVLGLIPFEGEIRVSGMKYSRKNRREFSASVQAVFQEASSGARDGYKGIPKAEGHRDAGTGRTGRILGRPASA